MSDRLRWAIVDVDLDPVKGHEQAGRRPVLVVSYEPFHRSGLVTVCPITSTRAIARYPGDVPIAVGEGGLTKAGVILCDQVRTLSVKRIHGPLRGVIADISTRRAVREALTLHLGLDIPAALDGAA